MFTLKVVIWCCFGVADVSLVSVWQWCSGLVL